MFPFILRLLTGFAWFGPCAFVVERKRDSVGFAVQRSKIMSDPDVVDLTDDDFACSSSSSKTKMTSSAKSTSSARGAAATQSTSAKLSTAISEVVAEIASIDEQIGELRRRKQLLIKKKEGLMGQVQAANVDYRDLEERWDRDGFEWSQRMDSALRETFKLPSFRPLQRAAINAVMSGEDVVVIMSTGSGKSLCYQLPAVISGGFALIVSPLVSLVEDQLHQLRKLGIFVASLNQSTDKDEAKLIDTAILDKKSDFRLLYVTPEKLAKSKRLMNKLEKATEMGRLKLIAIDEVHCCSQWGHDFRPDYKFLNVLKRQFKGVPIMGLTATATGNVLEDVKKMLGIEAALVFRAGFNRPNLHYEVMEKPKGDMGEAIAEIVKSRFSGECGIVYCLSRKDCEVVAKNLRGLGIRASFYHAYLEPQDKTAVHEQWLSGKCQIIVATIAFGMGIDKSNVRFVIHHSIPKSVENYYQESGRAGRDGKKASCILMYRLADVFRQSTIVCTESTGKEKLYEMVAFAANDMTCRRETLAGLFAEDWEQGWCQNCCDVCVRASSNGKHSQEDDELDVTTEAKLAVAVIDEGRSSLSGGSEAAAGRLTGAKIIDLMAKKSKRSRDFLEAVVTQMLLANMLTEDFHFTPYSIVSYVVKGSGYDAWLRSGTPFKRRIRVKEVAVKGRKRKAIVDSDEDD